MLPFFCALAAFERPRQLSLGYLAVRCHARCRITVSVETCPVVPDPIMARNESDREDLIREATALRNRIEWKIPDEPELVFAGIRSDGSLAIYFGPDPVYQFSIDGGLRRA